MRRHVADSALRVVAAALMSATAMACRNERPPTDIAVIGADYAFVAPDTVPVGPAIVRFANRGRMRHEMILARIGDSVSNKAFIDSLVSDARMVTMRATGSAVLFASPGRRNDIVRVAVDFRPGERYALWCRLKDSASAPRHTALGMLKVIAVK